MATILCATRGGEASHPAQDHAIALAQAEGVTLTFLYVTDARFLNGLPAPIIVGVESEMNHMGKYVLLTAQERAAKAGVEARGVLKSGVFADALIEAIREVGATQVVLGSPSDSNLTACAQLEAIAQTVKDATGVKTVIV